MVFKPQLHIRWILLIPVLSQSLWLQLLIKHCGRIHMSSKSTSMTNQLDEASNSTHHENKDIYSDLINLLRTLTFLLDFVF